MAFEETTIVPLPLRPIPMADQVRSTLIAASIQSLRQQGHFDRWQQAIAAEWRERLKTVPAGVWLPIDHAEAHYAACDKLGLGDDAILGMGNSVAELTQKTAFSLAARLVREAGATPITMLGIMPRLWSRLFTEGGIGATQTGPKDARFTAQGISLARYRYWRVGFRGIVFALTKPMCRTLIVRESNATPESLAFKMSWV
jgi:hypothetical protein